MIKKQSKAPKLLAVVVLTAVLMLMFTACGGGSGSGTPAATQSGTPAATQNAGIDASQLVGTWKEVDIDNTYVFNADGTGSENIFGDTFDMTWRLDGSHLYLDFVDANSEDYDVEIKGGNLFVHNPIVDYEYKKQ